MTPPETIVASRLRLAGIGLGGVALTATGVWMATTGEDVGIRVVGWLCAGFFGLSVAAVASMLVRPQQLTLDDDGFTLTTPFRRPHRYAWADIEAVFVWRMHMNRFVGFNWKPDRRPKGAKGVLTGVSGALGADGALAGGWPMSAQALADKMEARRIAADMAGGLD